eukprot:gene35175-35596_t
MQHAPEVKAACPWTQLVLVAKVASLWTHHALDGGVGQAAEGLRTARTGGPRPCAEGESGGRAVVARHRQGGGSIARV